MPKKVKIILTIITVIVLAPVVIPIVGIFLFPNLPGHNLLLRYLSTISIGSWWPLALIIFLVFFCILFYRQIAGKIETAKSIKTPKGEVAFTVEQPQPPPPPKAADRAVVPAETVAPDISKFKEVMTLNKKLERDLSFGKIIRSMYRSQFDLLLEIKRLNTMHIQIFVAWYETRFGGNKSITPFGKYTDYLFMSGLIEGHKNESGTLEIILTRVGNEFLEFAEDYPIAFLFPF